MSKNVPGFEVPVHRSLTESIKIGGVPRKMAILNGTFFLAFGLGAQSLLAFPLGLLIHTLLAVLTRNDPHILAVISRNLKRSSRLRL